MKTTIALFALLASQASASPLYSTTATLTGVSGETAGGYAVGPYYLTVGGEQFEAWCDDFADHVSIGQSWDVDVYAGTDTAGAYFTSDQYRDLFELVADGMAPGSDRITIQQAIWRLTYPLYTEGSQYTAMNQVYQGDFLVISGHGAPGERPQEFIVRRSVPPTISAVPPLIPTPEPSAWIMMGIAAGAWLLFKLFDAIVIELRGGDWEECE